MQGIFFIIFACLKRCLRQVLFPTAGANPVKRPRGISLAIHLINPFAFNVSQLQLVLPKTITGGTMKANREVIYHKEHGDNRSFD
jgi:hypothetical protein